MGEGVGPIRATTARDMDRQRQDLRVETVGLDHASSQEVQRVQLKAMRRSARGRGRVAVRSMSPLSDLHRPTQGMTEQGVQIACAHQHSAFTGEDQPMASRTRSITGAEAGLGPSPFREASCKVSCSRKPAVSTDGVVPADLARTLPSTAADVEPRSGRYERNGSVAACRTSWQNHTVVLIQKQILSY